MPAHKRESVASLKKRADKYHSIYIRMRDSDTHGIGECITCNKKVHWRHAQCGHFVSRSNNKLRYDELNTNLQCVGCNMFKSGEQYLYSKALDEKYGPGTAEELFSQRHDTHKFTVDELQEVIKDRKIQIKFYEADKLN